jgi:acyl-CoA hydrolase
MGIAEEYRSKLRTPQEAVKSVNSGNWVDYGFGANFPELLDRALAARKGEVEDVNIRGGLVIQPVIAVAEVDPEHESFTYNSWHFGNVERKLSDRGLCNYIPMTMWHLPYYYRKHINVDVAFIPVSKPDSKGFFGMGLSNSATRAILECAKIVILEVNEHYPTHMGENGSHSIHISEADMIVEGAHGPLPTRIYKDPSPEEIAISKHVIDTIEDGSVLTLGVGGVPDTIAKMVADSDLKDIGCHVGTISDAYLKLYESGKLTNARKEIHTGKSVWNLAIGSQRLYDWIGANHELTAPYPVEYVNDPHVISQMDRIVSLMGGIEIDLFGQESGESSGRRQISGSGGQLGFLNGGFLSRGGKSFISLTSTYTTKLGEVKSRLVPIVDGGSMVTAPRTMVEYIATEYGVVNVAGLTTWERAEKIISIAHPDFREELIRSADAFHLWRGSQKR